MCYANVNNWKKKQWTNLYTKINAWEMPNSNVQCIFIHQPMKIINTLIFITFTQIYCIQRFVMHYIYYIFIDLIYSRIQYINCILYSQYQSYLLYSNSLYCIYLSYSPSICQILSWQIRSESQGMCRANNHLRYTFMHFCVLVSA